MQTRQFKDNVKSAAAYLQQQGFNVPHTQLLEAISRSFGERNWSTMRALLESPPVSAPAEPQPLAEPQLSEVAARICKDIAQQCWDGIFGICSRLQAESMLAETAARIAPEATADELAEALRALWVD